MAFLQITGSLSPDATGAFVDAGISGGRTYYRDTTGSWALWYWPEFDDWILSEGPGLWSTSWHTGAGAPWPPSTLVPNYGATGTAALSLAPGSPLTAKAALPPRGGHPVRSRSDGPWATGTMPEELPPLVAAAVRCALPPRPPGLPSAAIEPGLGVWFGPGQTPVLPIPPAAMGVSTSARSRLRPEPRPVPRSQFASPPLFLDFSRLASPLGVPTNVRVRLPAEPRPRLASRVIPPAIFRRSYHLEARGLYRVFGAAGYRFYRSTAGPPATDAEPFATAAALPFTPADTFGDATWYLSVSYFNGVLDSGFLPLGPAGETWVALTIVGGNVVGNPPLAPLDWRLEAAAAGVVRVVGIYYEDAATRASQWAIGYTVDGGDPPADDPDLTEETAAGGLVMLSYELPAAADGATVRVRLQTRRNDGTEAAPAWVYSAGSTVRSIAADAAGPAAPIAAERWPGPLPQGEGEET